MKVICVLNNISETNIPMEAFNYIDNLPEANSINKQKIIFNTGSGILRNLTLFLKRINKEDRAIIHVHHCFSAFLVALNKFIFRKNNKLVLTVHSDFSKYSFLRKLAFRFIISNSTKVICNSNNTLNSIPRKIRNNYSKKFVVIYNGVCFDRITKAGDGYFDKDNHNIKIGMLGRLVDAKDYPTVLNAMQYISDNIHLYIVGGGDLLDELKNLANKLNLTTIFFEGALPRKDAYKFINSLDIFIAASKYEGFCNALIETKSAEIPTISSDNPTFCELLCNTNNLFYKVGNAQNLAEKIQHMHLNIDKFRVLAKKDAEIIRKKYSLRENALLHCKLYKNIWNESEN